MATKAPKSTTKSTKAPTMGALALAKTTHHQEESTMESTTPRVRAINQATTTLTTKATPTTPKTTHPIEESTMESTTTHPIRPPMALAPKTKALGHMALAYAYHLYLEENITIELDDDLDHHQEANSMAFYGHNHEGGRAWEITITMVGDSILITHGPQY